MVTEKILKLHPSRVSLPSLLRTEQIGASVALVELPNQIAISSNSLSSDRSFRL